MYELSHVIYAEQTSKTLIRIEAFAFNLPVRSYVGIIRSLLLCIPLCLGCYEEEKNRLPKASYAASFGRKYASESV